MVGFIEHKQLVAACHDSCRAQCHQIGFGTGIGETYLLDRLETLGDQVGEAKLSQIVRAQIQADIERLVDRPADRRVRMAEHAGRVFTKEV